ncbi:MAG: tyrosine-type recombinase/integrase [Candidatus Binataceae bacterium]
MAWLETVTKENKRYLRIGFKLPGRSGKFREPLGLEDNRRNRALAREQVQKAIEREIATGTFDYAKRFPDSPRVKRLGLQTDEPITLGDFAENVWLVERRASRIKRSTHHSYTDIFHTHIKPARIATMLLREIKVSDINAFKLELDAKRIKLNAKSAKTGRPLSARRKVMALRELGAILKLARRLDHVGKDLMFYVDKSFANEGAIEDAPGEKLSPFTADEVVKILGAASEDDPSDWERRLLEVLFFTGMRRGEAFGLRWSNVFFDRGVIAVRRSITIHGESSPKTARSIRDIEMLPRVRNMLLEQRRWVTGRFELGSEFVFPNGVGSPLEVHNFSFRVWPRIVKQAGIPYRALKQTRHTFATLMLQQGAPLDWLQRQMGHEDLQTLIKHYWKYINPQRLGLDVVARLEALGRDQSRASYAQLLPNSAGSALKSGEIAG